MAELAVADGPKTYEQMVAEKSPYYQKRIQRFEQFWEREVAKVEAAKQANEAITVTMPDGKGRPAVKGVTTPMDIAKEISASLAKKVVVADVDGSAWDLMRPLDGDCALKLFGFDDAEGRDVSPAAARAAPTCFSIMLPSLTGRGNPIRCGPAPLHGAAAAGSNAICVGW